MTDVLAQIIAQPYESENDPLIDQLSVLAKTVLTAAPHTFQVPTRGSILIIENTNATSSVTVTIASSADDFGRVADIESFIVVAGDQVTRKFLPKGWESQAGGGKIDITPSATGLQISCIAL